LSTRKSRKGLTITKISDMEGNPASSQMIRALAGRVDAVIREMGLSAKISIGNAQRNIHIQGEEENMRSKGETRPSTVIYPVEDQGC